MSYITDHRGLISASKLKDFMKSPEAYFYKYIKEVEVPELETKSLKIGTAIDDFISYGETEFNKKYWCKLKKTKAQLIEELEGVETKGLLVADLEVLYYGDTSEKIQLSELEREMVFKMIKEFKRQPLFDYDGEYKTQYRVKAKYKNLTLVGTLDRFSEEKSLIRDTKTTAKIKNFEWDCNQIYKYDISMAFYFALIYINTKQECEVILDVVSNQKVTSSRYYKFSKEKLLSVMSDTIIPALDTLSAITEAYEQTGDENLWRIKRPFNEYCESDVYEYLDSAIQKEFEYLDN